MASDEPAPHEGGMPAPPERGSPPAPPARAAGPARRLGHAMKRTVHRIPGMRVLLSSMHQYIVHQSANQAGSVAFSSVLALFPLLILLSAAAGFIGRPGDAAVLAGRVVGYAPPFVRQALQPVIDQVLAQRHQALLAIGLFATVWAASSGVQAIRTALNKAYGIENGLPFWKARLKVIAFTVVAGGGVVLAFSSVVVMPYVRSILDAQAEGSALLHAGVHYGSAYLVLTATYALLYAWLPDMPQRLRTVLPGAAVGALCWLGAAGLLSYSLRGAGKLLLVYGSFAGLVATLVFLYLSASTLIFGAEINGVLLRRARDEARGA